eukprot:8612878-Pyramimonas_sp.AAC.1
MARRARTDRMRGAGGGSNLVQRMRGRMEGRRSTLMLWKDLQDGIRRMLRWGRGADCDDEYD